MLLVSVSAHVPLQLVVPGGHAHSPLSHTRLPAQICAQNPQFLLSLVRSTHVLPHRLSPLVHVMTQAPPAHRGAVGGHRVPHAPQFVSLVSRSTQAFPHCVLPCGQEQVPPMHRAPAGHRLPHAPQFALFVSGSAHAPPHTI